MTLELFETKHPVDKQLLARHINSAARTLVDNPGSSDVTDAFQLAIKNVFDMGGKLVDKFSFVI